MTPAESEALAQAQAAWADPLAAALAYLTASLKHESELTEADFALLRGMDEGAVHAACALAAATVREAMARDAVYAAADRCRNSEECKSPCLCTRVTAELLAAAAARRAAMTAMRGEGR